MADVKAVRVDDLDQDQRPGAFAYFRSGDRYPAGMDYRCPCGCGQTGPLDFRPHESPSWEWDGNIEAPTLKPSVHHRYLIRGEWKTHWHGYLTAGIWKEC